jgi:hypothetical protein
VTITAGQAGAPSVDALLAALPGRALTLANTQLDLADQQTPATLTVAGELPGTWELPGLMTQSLVTQSATITYLQDAPNAPVTAGLTVKATYTVGTDTVDLIGTLGQQADLAFAWSATEPGGTLSVADAIAAVTDGQYSYELPLAGALFSGMSLSSCLISFGFTPSTPTTVQFSLDADPEATWDIAPGPVKRIGVTFTATYEQLSEDLRVSFGGNIHAALDLGQEFDVAVGLTPGDIWELDLKAPGGYPALDSLAALAGAEDEVRNGLAALGLGEILLRAVRVGIYRADNSLAFLAVYGSLSLAGTTFDVIVTLPDFGFGAALPKGATISLAALLTYVLGSTGGLPDLVISDLALMTVPQAGYYSLDFVVSDGEIGVGRYGLTSVSMSLDKQGSAVTGSISAAVTLAGSRVAVQGSYDAGWTVAGALDQLSLPALIAEALPSVALPAELTGLNLANLSASWNLTTGSFTFSGQADLALALGPKTLSSSLTLTVNSAAGHTTTAALTGTVALGTMTFHLRYDFAPGRQVLTGTWDNAGKADIATLAAAFGVALPPSQIQLPAIELTSVSFNLNWASAGEQAVLLSAATSAGDAFFLVQRPQSSQNWAFAFGVTVATATCLSQVIELVGINAAELDFIAIERAYLLVASAAYPALQVPGFAALAGRPVAVSAGVSAGLRLNFGATPPRADVTALRTLLGPRPPVFDADLTLSRDLRQFAVTVRLDGNLTIRGAPGSSLTLTDVSLVLKPEPVALTVHGSVTFKVDNTMMTATGFLTVGGSGLSAAFAIAGTGGNALPSPLGLKGVHLTNIGVELEAAVEPPSVALGLLGRFTIGPAQPPPGGGSAVPARTLAAKPPPGEFALILGLEGEVPNPLLLSMFLPVLSVEEAIKAFTDQQPAGLPPVFRDIRATDLMIYWCDAPAGIQLPDGTWAYAGFGFNANLDIYGLHAHGELKADSRGITGNACIDPIHISKVIDLTGKGKGTPAAYTGQVTVRAGGPEIKVSSLASPYLDVNWVLVLFGTVSQSVNVVIDQRGFQFQVSNAGPGYSSALTCQFDPKGRLELALSVLLNLDVDLGVVNGSHLGRVHLGNTGFAARLIATAMPNLSITVDGTFMLDGTMYTMPRLTATVAFGSLSEIPRRIFDQVQQQATKIFDQVRTTASTYLELTQKGIIAAGDEVGTVLRVGFQQTADQAAIEMKAAGYQLNQIGVELQRAYNATAQQAAGALKQAGYAADQVAQLLRSVGYGFDEIGTALHVVFNLSPDELAAVLKLIGDDINDVGNLLRSLYGLGPADLGPVLQALGYAAEEVKRFFEELGHEFEEAVKHLDPTTW